MSESDEAVGVWQRLDGGRVVFQSRFLTLREDRVRTPDGRESTYGVIDCGHCVGVLPFVDDDTVWMVRQHRYIADRFTWEMPTGGVNRGEPTEDAAQRELAEEAGFRAGRLVHVSSYHTSKSCMDETAHLFLGYDLTPAAAKSDPDEQIERRALPFADVVSMVSSGEITDGMTIVAVLSALRLRAAR